MEPPSEFRFDEDVLAQQSWLGDSQLLGGSQSPLEWTRSRWNTPTKEGGSSTTPRASPHAEEGDATNLSRLLQVALSPSSDEVKAVSPAASPAPAKAPTFFQQALSQSASHSARLRGTISPVLERGVNGVISEPHAKEPYTNAAGDEDACDDALPPVSVGAPVSVYNNTPPPMCDDVPPSILSNETPLSNTKGAAASVFEQMALHVEKRAAQGVKKTNAPVVEQTAAMGFEEAAAPTAAAMGQRRGPYFQIPVEPLDPKSAAKMLRAKYPISVMLRIPASRKNGILKSATRRLTARWSLVSATHRLQLCFMDERPFALLYSWEAVGDAETSESSLVAVEDPSVQAASERVERLEAELAAARRELEEQKNKRRRLVEAEPSPAVSHSNTNKRQSPQPVPPARRRRALSPRGKDQEPCAVRSPCARLQNRSAPLETVPEEQPEVSPQPPISPSCFDSNIDLPWEASSPLRSRVDRDETCENDVAPDNLRALTSPAPAQPDTTIPPAPAPIDHLDPAFLSSNLSNLPWIEDSFSNSGRSYKGLGDLDS